MKCIRCDKMMKYIKNMPTNLDGGVEVIVQAYYGSRHDGESFETIMCDDCFDVMTGSEEE